MSVISQQSLAPPAEVPSPTAARAGLSEQEALARLARDGPNELPDRDAHSLLAILRDVLAEPMFVLLLGSSLIYLVLGEPRDAFVLACSLVVVVAITVYQERRTDRTLQALRNLASPRASVIRDGVQRRIAGREVVHGDLVLLREGDRVPADGLLRDCVGIAADESLLTGESVPVTKRAETGNQTLVPPGGDDLPFVYSGTLVVRGHGIAEVVATGPRTCMGAIGERLSSLENERTPLQLETAKIVRIVALAALALCVAVTGLLATRGSLLEGALAGITLAMSLLPEEFPVVLTIFLALGAWRISRQRVLTRRAAVIEALGAATVLAVDKTGTLTENRMEVRLAETSAACIDLRANLVTDERAAALLGIAFGACELDAVDPMDLAIVRAANAHAASGNRAYASMSIVREWDVSAELLAVVHAWRAAGERSCRLTAKGAPEAIVSLCAMDAAQRSRWLASAAAHATDGLRVLAVAHATCDADRLPQSPAALTFDFDGLLGLIDPVRPDVPDAIAECRSAGIRVVMITGDHPATGAAIAGVIGLDLQGGILTGAELGLLHDAALAERVKSVNVFARMVPEQKLRLVEAFKANGDVVAMTGDGVNDAPALKAAHIGVAMGSRGSDVAREAAGLILLEDDFGALVGTVRMGRRIYENIRNAFAYLIAVHIPLGGMGLLPALLGWPVFLLPVHVVFVEFVIDPACSIVFEAERGAHDLMARPPRPVHASLFSRGSLVRTILLGTTMLIAIMAVYRAALSAAGPDAARAEAFVTMIVANVILIASCRSRRAPAIAMLFRPNVAFLIIAVSVGLALLIVLYFPPAVRLFRFESPAFMDVAFAAGLGAASVLWFDLVKLIRLPSPEL